MQFEFRLIWKIKEVFVHYNFPGHPEEDDDGNLEADGEAEDAKSDSDPLNSDGAEWHAELHSEAVLFDVGDELHLG